MKKKSIIIAVVIIIVCVILIISLIEKTKKEENQNRQETMDTLEEEYNQMRQDSEMYHEEANITTLKEEYQMAGEDAIYEIVKEPDGRNILTVNRSLNVKVAFAGMIKNELPKKEEIDTINKQSFPKNTGIYIAPKDQDKIVYDLNHSKYLKNTYKINQDGFIEVEKRSKIKTDYDQTIEELIKEDKTYILSINGICYMIDPVTGEIVDNPYNEMDKKQMYEYFEDDNRCIIFMTDRKDISQDEILIAILNLNHN